MKLVHLQGYPDELLPVTVYGIPSIHIALDFLPELLNQPLIERQIFAVKLAGHLIEKYTLPKWYDLYFYGAQNVIVIHHLQHRPSANSYPKDALYYGIER